MAQILDITDSVTATARVFGIFELAEDILLQMPIADLIHISRVSKQFQSIVTNSKPLQRALFLKPLAGESVILVKPTPGRMLFRCNETSEVSVRVLGNPFTRRIMRGVNSDDAAFFRQDASWRRMLLSQPPMRRVEDKQGRKYRDDHGVKLLQSLVAGEKRPHFFTPNYIEAYEFFKRIQLAVDVKRDEKPVWEVDKSLHGIKIA